MDNQDFVTLTAIAKSGLVPKIGEQLRNGKELKDLIRLEPEQSSPPTQEALTEEEQSEFDDPDDYEIIEDIGDYSDPFEPYDPFDDSILYDSTPEETDSAEEPTESTQQQPYEDLPISIPTGFKGSNGMIYPTNLKTLFTRYPPEACNPDYLIQGTIRKNSLTAINAASKCKKSFLIQGLALAIACGTTFLDQPVAQGKVLLVDPELRTKTFVERMRGLISSMPGISLDDADKNLTVITLRGADKRDYIKTLTTYLENCRTHNIFFDAIIIDSVYMLVDGDENSSSQMGAMMQGLIGIADSYGAVFCTMHVSKATAAGKSGYEVADRSVGSNIVGRACDNVMSISRCDSVTSDREFFKVELVLREDKTPSPVYIVIDESGPMPYHKVIDDPAIYGLTDHNSKYSERIESNKAKITQLKSIYDELISTQGIVRRSDIESRMGISSNTARTLISQAGFDCNNGIITPKS